MKNIIEKKTQNKKSRRSKGEGCLRQKPNGSWEAIVNIKKYSGDSITKSICRKNKSEVLLLKSQLQALEPLDDDVIKIEIKGCKILQLKQNGTNTFGEKSHIDKEILVKDYIDYWLWNHRKNGVVENSFADYVEKCNHIKAYLGELPVKALTFEIIQNTILSIQKNTCDTTAVQVKNHLKNMLNYACNVDFIIENNPLSTRQLKLSTHKKKAEKLVLTRDDENKLIKYCIENNADDLLVAIFSGCRSSELRGLTWNCINLTECTITIEKQYVNLKHFDYTDGKLIKTSRERKLTELKTPASYRTLGIPKELAKRLADLKERQRLLAKSLNIKFSENDFVFTNAKYQIRGRNFLREKLKRIAKLLNLKDHENFSLHNLRHNYCTRGIENHVQLPEMQRLLGHAKASVTAEWYTHLDNSHLKKATNNVNSNRLKAFNQS